MKSSKVNLESIRVNQPCASDWKRMAGDDRTRFCADCNKQVYNLSAMTRQEIASLIAETEGKFCALVLRDTNGSVITASPNGGDNLFNLRASRIASAFITVTLAVSQYGFAHTSSNSDAPKMTQSIKQPKGVINPNLLDQSASIYGIVYDPYKAMISGAEVTIKNKSTGEEFKTRSSDEGVFKFNSLTLGIYDLVLNANGFKRITLNDLNLTNGYSMNLELEPQVAVMGGAIIVAESIKPIPLSERLLAPIRLIKELVKKPEK